MGSTDNDFRTICLSGVPMSTIDVGTVISVVICSLVGGDHADEGEEHGVSYTILNHSVKAQMFLVRVLNNTHATYNRVVHMYRYMQSVIHT